MLAGWTLAGSFGATAYNGLSKNISALNDRLDRLNVTIDIFMREQMERRGRADQRVEDTRRRIEDLEDKFYQRRGR